MTVRLVILGLLNERPLYGYEIKHVIEDHMGDWTSIAFGSIYFALNKMAEEGYVEKIATEKEGNRPSRSVYQITDDGRVEFKRLLRTLWQDVEREYFPLDICIFFMRSLPVEEIITFLHQRISRLRATLGYINEHRESQLTNPNVPRLAAAIFDHSAVHTKAELAWTQDLLEKLEKGTYP